MRIDRRKRLQVLSVSDASSGMLNACKQHCILCTIDLSFGKKWYKTYQESNRVFKDYKVILDKDLKDRDRSQYEELREIASAKVTNEVNPLLINWLNKNKSYADLFVRNAYTYATARSSNSSKYVIAK